jgi:DNA-binding CsgD family transcriptional regulator
MVQDWNARHPDNISEGTSKNHVRNLLGRLDLRDRTQSIIFAQPILSLLDKNK